MSLRSRLTTAFLVVVLGPVLVGAVFVAAVMSHLAESRSQERLDAAVAAVDATLGTICERISASAAAVALNYGTSGTGGAVDMAELVIDRRVVDGVILDGVDGPGTVRLGSWPPAGAWIACGDEELAPDVDADAVALIGARAEVAGPDGTTAEFTAYRLVDQFLIDRLASTVEAQIVLADGRAATVSGGTPDADRWRFTDTYIPLRVGVDGTDIAAMYWMLATMVVVSAFCAVGLATWLARSTTRPLAELSQAADKFTDGDLDVRVPVHGSDEVAQLAMAFNHMTAQTQRYVQALTASRDQMRGQLHRLGQTLTATLDLDRILDVILDTASVATGAQGGVVMLVDVEDPGLLVQRAGQGRLGIEGTASVRLGEGVLGNIAAAGRPMLGRMVGGTFEGWRRVDTEPQAETLIAVPFVGRRPAEPVYSGEPPRTGRDAETAEDGLLGVLVLYDHIGDDRFDESDVETLETFAGQVAVAVENVLLHRQAQRLSLTDPLTGLWNYRFMQASLRREAERVRRYRRPSALLAIDLDLFKAVNDTHGHPVGDQVLVELARRITGQIREVDLAFRHGGEEFMVLLPETDGAGASAVAERLGGAVARRPFKVNVADGGLELNVTVSVGIAVLGEHADTAAGVIAAADEALYAAKAAGRATWRMA